MKRMTLWVTAALLAIAQGGLAQNIQPSNRLTQLSTMNNSSVYEFYYPSVNSAGERVVLSSALVAWTPESPQEGDWRSFATGYSQGGAVALAVQRHIEEERLAETLHFQGSICGDGPYDLIETMRYYYADDNCLTHSRTTRSGAVWKRCSHPTSMPI